jgi:RNase adaptor protein for sRNA GlmZ degradation
VGIFENEIAIFTQPLMKDNNFKKEMFSMDKKEIDVQMAEVEAKMQELMDRYSNIRKMDAEQVKRNRLKHIQIEIGRNARKLEDLEKELSNK